MAKKKVIINRLCEGNYQTVGFGSLIIEGVVKYSFATLERPNLHNKFSVSSIPVGKYEAQRIVRHSNKKDAILLFGTEPRTEILIHSGNYKEHSQGCILIGESFFDINKDGVYDITNSNATIKNLMSFIDKDEHITVEVKKLNV